MGFYGWGKTRVGEDSIETKDIVVGGEIELEAVSKGGGDDQGCDGEFCGSSGGGESRIGVPEGGGEFNGHDEGKGCTDGGTRDFLMRETRGAK